MSMTRNRSRTSAKRRGQKPGRPGSALRGAAGMIGGRGRPRRRGRGITATELRGFNKVSGLLGRWGMAPRKMRGARKAPKRR